ncbi:hypothetical protein SLS56_011474 [Neofusicoccum ribis]|uniref:Ankyrin repeat protein n=1 Tax=Neofusicoccum ribis TaxID=45134 RepID=A0ABR3SC64_9PEZI
MSNGARKFLWAKLQMRIICRYTTAFGVMNSLNNLPLHNDMQSLYQRIVQEFEYLTDWERDVARKAISLLVNTMRLIPLQALPAALALDMENTELDKIKLSNLTKDPQTAVRICNPLVEIDEELGVYRLCHPSVYDYFSDHPPSGGHGLVAEISLSYLCLPQFSRGPFKGATWLKPGQLEIFMRDHPFLEIASCHRGRNLRMSKAHESKSLLKLFKKPQNLLLSFQVLWVSLQEDVAVNVCPTHVVCYFGVIGFLESPRRLLDLRKYDSFGQKAVLWAIKSEASSIEVDNSKDDEHRTPLYYATRCGNLEVVKLLLEKRAKVNSKSKRYGTALTVAAHKRHVPIVGTLIATGADVNINGKFGTALHAAASSGCEGSAALILEQKKLWLNEHGDRFGTALHSAAYNGHDRIVEMLLDKGFDVNNMSRSYGSPLAAAAAGCFESIDSEPFKKTFQILLNYGANVNARGGMHETALHAAARFGHSDLVEMLLDNGATVDMPSPLGTPYHVASDNRNLEVMEILRDRGASTTEDSCEACADSDSEQGQQAPRKKLAAAIWVPLWRHALANNDNKKIEYMVSAYEKAFEGAIKGQKQGFIRQLATLSERIFVMVITLATRQHEPKTNSYLKRKLKMAWHDVSSAFSSSTRHPEHQPSPLDDDTMEPGRSPLHQASTFSETSPVENLAAASILSCALQSGDAEAVATISGTWVTGLHNLMVSQGDLFDGREMVERLVKARADELRSILADPDLEPDDRRDAASRLADVGVELLATAFARGDEYRPLVGSFARLWACAVSDAAGGGSGGGGQPIRKKDVADVIEAFFMKFRDALRAGDGKRVELIAEAGVEILIEIAISGNEVLLEMMADNLARMMREAVERNMEDLLAKVLQRRREALEGQPGDPRLDATMREDLIRIFTLESITGVLGIVQCR